MSDDCFLFCDCVAGTSRSVRLDLEYESLMPAMSDDFPEPEAPVMRMRREALSLLICDGVGDVE